MTGMSKKIKCNVCDNQFVPLKKNRYTSIDKMERGLVTIMRDADTNMYDTFDCPKCGCQIIVQERKRKYVEHEVGKDEK